MATSMFWMISCLRHSHCCQLKSRQSLFRHWVWRFGVFLRGNVHIFPVKDTISTLKTTWTSLAQNAEKQDSQSGYRNSRWMTALSCLKFQFHSSLDVNPKKRDKKRWIEFKGAWQMDSMRGLPLAVVIKLCNCTDNDSVCLQVKHSMTQSREDFVILMPYCKCLSAKSVFVVPATNESRL